MTTQPPYPNALPRCLVVERSSSGVEYSCALPAHLSTPNAHHFVRAEAHRASCGATKTTSAGIVFACCLKRHTEDPDAHFFRDQVGSVPVRRKHHLSLYNGGLS